MNIIKDKHPLSPEEFSDIFSKVPRLTVEVVIKTDDGFLLTKRSIEPYIGTWHIPGGTVRFKETLHDALRRVALDELGVMVEPSKLLGYIEYPNVLRAGHGWPIGIAFLSTIVKGEPRGSEQGEEVGYFTKLPVNTFPEQKVFLESLNF